jgi:HCOMODA/2-hydroxy-3-carboxy-muconic semialdehyde decarboxylase
MLQSRIFRWPVVVIGVAALTATRLLSAASAEEEDRQRIADLVLANHILADQGVVDGFGHISVRSAKDPNRYFISRSLAPGLVSADDVMQYDLDDNAIDARGRASYLERFIHSEIYKARPDIQSIVHSHSPAIIPFAASEIRLRPIYHMAGFLVRAVPVFEIRTVAGNDSDMLIRNKALGAALAKTLDQGTAVLMRGHGAVAIGSSIKTAVAHAIYLDTNARLQTQALILGGTVEYLNEAEAAKTGEVNDQLVDRPWEVWKIQALGNERAPKR